MVISCRCSCSFLVGSGPLGPAVIGCFSGDPAELHPDNWVHFHPLPKARIGSVRREHILGVLHFWVLASEYLIWIQSVMKTLSGP